MSRDSRDRRNYGAGRRLEGYLTRYALAETARVLNGRGLKFTEQACSALASLAAYMRICQVTYLEKATREMISGWAKSLKDLLDLGQISRSTTSSYVSAANQVFRACNREDLCISALSHGINRGIKYSNKNLSNSPDAQRLLKTWLAERIVEADERLERLMLTALGISADLQTVSGARFRESCLIKLHSKNVSNGTMEWNKADGTKNGRSRLSHLYDAPSVIAAMSFVHANKDIFSRGSLVPENMSYRQYERWAKDILAKFRRDTGTQYHWHGNRHQYAHRRYADLWQARSGVNVDPPVIAGLFGPEHIRYIAEKTGMTLEEAKEADIEIRHAVARDLGHGDGDNPRYDIGWAYLGR
jgi:hypothetical protein